MLGAKRHRRGKAFEGPNVLRLPPKLNSITLVQNLTPQNQKDTKRAPNLKPGRVDAESEAAQAFLPSQTQLAVAPRCC